jgi:hypothetical protein
VDMWPPASLLDPSGLPVPLSLPGNYKAIPPADSTFVSTYIGLLNDAYQTGIYEQLTLYPIPPTPLTITFSPPDAILFLFHFSIDYVNLSIDGGRIRN